MTTGESHGPALAAVIEGAPVGLELQTSDFEGALWRRRLGYGRGARQKFEGDRVKILGEVRHGPAFSAPIAIEIANSGWPKQETVVSADPVNPQALLINAGNRDECEIAHNKPSTRPRPGYADLAGMLSYELENAGPVLERASARETMAHVTLGAVTETTLSQVGGAQLLSHVIQVGDLCAEEPIQPMPGSEEALNAPTMRTLDAGPDQRFRELAGHAKAGGDTIRGVMEVIVWGVPTGLGSHVSARARLDAKIAHTFMSIQSVKGVEIGDSFAQAAMLGPKAHDEILKSPGGRLLRAPNHAGGIEGGTSNGQPIVVRAASKTIPAIPRVLRSADLASEGEVLGLHQRSDICQLVPGALIAQAELAPVLTGTLFEHAGGRSITEMRRNLEAHRQRVGERV